MIIRPQYEKACAVCSYMKTSFKAYSQHDCYSLFLVSCQLLLQELFSLYWFKRQSQILANVPTSCNWHADLASVQQRVGLKPISHATGFITYKAIHEQIVPSRLMQPRNLPVNYEDTFFLQYW
jgi:hypothetical protein